MTESLPTTADLRSLERLIAGLAPEAREELAKQVEPVLAKPWLPQPGPQTMAYYTEAEVVLYGGSAGSGKSSLLNGVAATAHERSLILRREVAQIDGLVTECKAICEKIPGSRWNGQDNEMSLPGGRSIKFGGMKEPDDWRKYAGRARDLIGLDEAAEFLEVQVASIKAWLRSATGHRCRMILATNPPRGPEGEWVLRWFAPWLDPFFPNPAKAGEIRWCITVGDQLRWVDGPGITKIDGEEYEAESRTFIPGRLDDNVYLADTDYRKRLQNLQGPLRAQLLRGDFLAGREDDEWQVIPTDWIKAAQARWTPDGHRGLTMTAMGVDVAQGGADHTIIAPRYGTWFAPLISRPGAETPEVSHVAGMIVASRRDGAAVVIDVGGGYGGGVVTWLKESEITAAGFNGANGSTARTADNALAFVNLRAEAWWRFREALDPSQEGGSPIALPPDQQLAADLASPKWSLKTRGIQIEDKNEIKARLGRSPDRGDAVVMAWSRGQALAARKQMKGGFGASGRPQVILGYAGAKRGRR